MLKQLVRSLANSLGYDIVSRPRSHPRSAEISVPDESFYRPRFSPWFGYGGFDNYFAIAQPYTLVSRDRCFTLLSLAKQAAQLPGDWIECGVYKGGTAMILAKALSESNLPRCLHLFDTFSGMPNTNPDYDWHKRGDFHDTSLEAVKERVGQNAGHARDRVFFHPGFIPETFQEVGVEQLSFAHVDVDIYKSVHDSCSWIYPRLRPSGFIIFDDYGFRTCPGARRAVDEFFSTKPEVPLVLPTGQALVIKAT